MRLLAPSDPMAHRFGDAPATYRCGKPWVAGTTEALDGDDDCPACVVLSDELRRLRKTIASLREELALAMLFAGG